LDLVNASTTTSTLLKHCKLQHGQLFAQLLSAFLVDGGSCITLCEQ
jgi:hypothetical protein